jgi:hypothetical protein
MTTRDVIRFDYLPPPTALLVWRWWLRAHGVDPASVVVPGWIERREDARQLAWLGCTCAAHAPTVPRPHLARTAERVLQLESPPLSWPTLP